MHNHHHHGCNHDNIKFCKHCDKPYCVDCGREWGTYTWTSPYIWDTNTIKYGSAGNAFLTASAGEDAAQLTNTACNHGE